MFCVSPFICLLSRLLFPEVCKSTGARWIQKAARLLGHDTVGEKPDPTGCSLTRSLPCSTRLRCAPSPGPLPTPLLWAQLNISSPLPAEKNELGFFFFNERLLRKLKEKKIPKRTQRKQRCPRRRQPLASARGSGCGWSRRPRRPGNGSLAGGRGWTRRPGTGPRRPPHPPHTLPGSGCKTLFLPESELSAGTQPWGVACSGWGPGTGSVGPGHPRGGGRERGPHSCPHQHPWSDRPRPPSLLPRWL